MCCDLPQEKEFTTVRLTLKPGVAATFRDNDAILLSKDNPHVSLCCC